MSTIYLIHIEPPYKQARHYLGSTENGVEERLTEHRAGRGARLTQVAVDAGCQLLLVRTWEGGRGEACPERSRRERRLKNHKNSPRLCPLCNPQAWQKRGDL